MSLEFEFDAGGLIRAVRSAGRYRLLDGQQVGTPWEGRFWDYERRDGMRISLAGQVAWLPPDGPRPYWRGRIERIEYEYG